MSDDFLGAMYGNDDDEPTRSEAGHQDEIGIKSGLVHTIKNGGVSVTVPSIEYVTRIENIVVAQARRGISQERQIKKLINDIKLITDALRKLGATNRDIQRELDNKIDGGGW